jgi:hypothetical protein
MKMRPGAPLARERTDRARLACPGRSVKEHEPPGAFGLPTPGAESLEPSRRGRSVVATQIGPGRSVEHPRHLPRPVAGHPPEANGDLPVFLLHRRQRRPDAAHRLLNRCVVVRGDPHRQRSVMEDQMTQRLPDSYEHLVMRVLEVAGVREHVAGSRAQFRSGRPAPASDGRQLIAVGQAQEMRLDVVGIVERQMGSRRDDRSG